MSFLDDLARDRSENEATSVAQPCRITAVQYGKGITVSVVPLMTTEYDTFNGEREVEKPLPVEEIPYSFPVNNRFGVFVPPHVGMEGILVVSDTEVGEVPSGEVKTSRRKNPRSGYFVPTGSVAGQSFRGSPDWVEIRSKACRVAVSDDTVHLETDRVSVVLDDRGFDVLVGGKSLIEALKEMSAHIRALEAFVHPNGLVHGPVKARMIDSFSATSAPERNETGI